jgi:subtilisin family serine protease
MTEYLVLRDLSRPVTGGPFEPPGGGSRARVRALEEVPAEPVVQAEQLSKADVLDLARDPQVHAIAPAMPIRLVEPAEVAESDAATTAWGITAVGADVSTRDGSGVTVAVLDTGIDAGHKAFVGVNLVEQDFTGTGNGDVKGHGSHCAGTIFGRDVEGTRIGVARGVGNALIGKVLGNDGRGDSTMLFKGIQWAIENGAQVISMSLGFDFPGLAKRLVAEQDVPVDLATSIALEGYRANLRMFDALMALVRSREAFGVGTVVVAAAGNESHREIDPAFEVGVSVPAAAEGVVSVGALQQTPAGLAVAPFSNTFPQVGAPGVNVLSVKVGGGLRALSGTSMATPHVAGVTALWWQEVANSPLPSTTAVVTSRLLARARTDGFAPGVDVADRGVGLVAAP